MEAQADGAARPPRTVLVLMADTGAGHSSAAAAIVEAMRLADEPDWAVQVVDGVRACGRFPFRNGIFLYGPATKYAPRIFGAFFHLTDSPRHVALASRLCRPFLQGRLRSLIGRSRPDVIVSTHHVFNHYVPGVVRDLGLRTPLISVITDLITIHQVWAAPDVDTWVAPTAVARRFLLDHGVPPARIHSLGLPIHPSFACAPAGSREERRAALGLDPKRPVVLLAGGGEGVGGLRRVARALEGEDLPAQLVIVTGRNRALRRELLRRQSRFRMPARVLGFVGNMPELMRAADVLVSKAGSLTVSEALAAGLPIVLMGALPGQEEGNVSFITDHDAGAFAPTPALVVAQLRRLLAPDDQTLARMRANAARLARPEAAHAVARLVFAHLPPPPVGAGDETRDAMVVAPRDPAAVDLAPNEGNDA